MYVFYKEKLFDQYGSFQHCSSIMLSMMASSDILGYQRLVLAYDIVE